MNNSVHFIRVGVIALTLLASTDTQGANDSFVKWIRGGFSGRFIAASGATNGVNLATVSDDITLKVWSLTNGSVVRTFWAETPRTIAMSPDGSKVAWSTEIDSPKSVIVIDVPSGNEIARFTSGSNRVESVAFSPDGSKVATGDATGSVRLWNLSNQQQVWSTNGHAGVITALAFSPSGSLLASASPEKMKTWNTLDGSLVNIFPGGNFSRSIAFSADGTTMLTGNDGGPVELWNTSTTSLITNYVNHGSTKAVAFSHNNLLIASGGDDRKVTIQSAQTGQILWDFDTHTNRVNWVGFSADDGVIYSTSAGGEIKGHELTNGTAIPLMSGHASFVRAVAYSPNGQLVASGSWDGTARIYRASDGLLLHTLSGHSGQVSSVVFSPDSQLLASGSSDASIIVWNVNDGSTNRVLAGHSQTVSALDFTPNGSNLVSGSWDWSLRVWRLSDGELLGTITEDVAQIWSLDVSPDGQRVAAGSSLDRHNIWNLSDGSLYKSLQVNNSSVWAKYTPDGNTILTVGPDSIVRRWNSITGQKLADYPSTTSPFGMAWQVHPTPSGLHYLTVLEGFPIEFRRTSDGRLISKISREVLRTRAAAVSPDGRYVFLGREDASVALIGLPLALSIERVTNSTASLQVDGPAGVTAMIDWSTNALTWESFASPVLINGFASEPIPSTLTNAIFRARFTP